MTCDDVTGLMYLFICDELDDDESELVSAHLFSCKACRTALAETVQIAGALSAALPQIPQNFYSINN